MRWSTPAFTAILSESNPDACRYASKDPKFADPPIHTPRPEELPFAVDEMVPDGALNEGVASPLSAAPMPCRMANASVGIPFTAAPVWLFVAPPVICNGLPCRLIDK